MFSRADTTFNFDEHLIYILREIPFFAEFSRHISKVPTRDKRMPTAAIAYDVKNDELTMFWNPDFFEKLKISEIKGVVIHEFYHAIFQHVQARRKTPATMWNIATDLAINSIIVEGKNANTSLPEFCLIPGQLPKHPSGRDFTKTEKQAHHLANLIKSLPVMQASEWYFEKLYQDRMENPGSWTAGEGECEIESMDNHDVWDELPEEKREFIEGKVRSFIEKASKHADGRANGWGDVPSEIQRTIREYVSNIVDWRSVLRQFVGTLARAGRTNSIKRINKKYPYIHPGHKTAHSAKLLIALDESGSVDDVQLALFFSELRSLTKRVSVDLLPFDCSANIKNIFPWKKGAMPVLNRTLTGGTNFDAPSDIVNAPENRGRWDGYIILTDGGAPKPRSSRTKRGWCLSMGNKLMFESSELQIFMTDAKTKSGTIR